MTYDDPPITRDEYLALLAARIGKEPSMALPAHFYSNPQNKEVSVQKTKDAEKLLEVPLDNWIRWGKKRDWMPTGFRCPLGFMYKPKAGDVHQEDRLNKPVPVDSEQAVRFERLVLSLPERHRAAFVMYELGRAADQNMIVIIKGRDHAARLLGVQKSQYHDIVRQAMNILLREWGE
jgi:hypothetical protein